MIYSAGLKSCAIFFSFPLFAENFNPAFRKEKKECANFLQSIMGNKKRKQFCSCFLSKRLIRYSAG